MAQNSPRRIGVQYRSSLEYRRKAMYLVIMADHRAMAATNVSQTALPQDNVRVSSDASAKRFRTCAMKMASIRKTMVVRTAANKPTMREVNLEGRPYFFGARIRRNSVVKRARNDNAADMGWITRAAVVTREIRCSRPLTWRASDTVSSKV